LCDAGAPSNKEYPPPPIIILLLLLLIGGEGYCSRATKTLARINLSDRVRAGRVRSFAELRQDVRTNLRIGEVDVFDALDLFKADTRVTVD
jgi:hypothetical protein